MQTRVLLAHVERATGARTLDERFRAEGSQEPGLGLEGSAWLHGGSDAEIPHGAPFSRGRRG